MSVFLSVPYTRLYRSSDCNETLGGVLGVGFDTEKLREAVIAIQTAKPIAYSLEELYQAVENVCSHKMDALVYTQLTNLTESHVKANIQPFLAESMDKLVFLKKINEWWQAIVSK